MDEVGRGTTVKDGLAIAFATIHHLVRENKCRALFATHFHELSTMLGCSENKGSGVFENVAFFCTGIDETDVSAVLIVTKALRDILSKEDHFSYSYRVKPGVNYDSHGLKVAQLAGMPDSAMRVAKKVLQCLGSQGGTNLGTLGQLLTGPDSN
jgi:DNA mismatch repair ATPase MutS